VPDPGSGLYFPVDGIAVGGGIYTLGLGLALLGSTLWAGGLVLPAGVAPPRARREWGGVLFLSVIVLAQALLIVAGVRIKFGKVLPDTRGIIGAGLWLTIFGAVALIGVATMGMIDAGPGRSRDTENPSE